MADPPAGTHNLGALLRYLADLAPARSPSDWVGVGRRSDFVLLDWAASRAQPRQRTVRGPHVYEAPPGGLGTRGATADWERRRAAVEEALPLEWFSSQPEIERLVELDEVHATERLLRLGWLFLAGRVEVEGDPVRVLLPLARAPVRAELTPGGEHALRLDSDLQAPEHLIELGDRDAVEEGLDQLAALAFADGRLDAGWATTSPAMSRWVRQLLQPAGLGMPQLLPPDEDPRPRHGADGWWLCTGMAVYLARDVDAPNVAGALRTWASRDLAATAFAAIYGQAQPPAPRPEDEAGRIGSPLPLNEAQRDALLATRSAPVTVISGPPGTGKSHLVAAIAIDEVSRGNSVLVATQSDFAADVVGELLERVPGPRFVRFGRSAARFDVADELGSGLATPYNRRDRQRLERELDEAAADVQRWRDRISDLLERERAMVTGLDRRRALAPAAADAPRASSADFDVERAGRLLAIADGDAGRLLFGLRRRVAARRLRRRLGAGAGLPFDRVRAAFDLAAAEAAVRRATHGGGLALSGDWEGLEQAEERWRAAAGRAAEAQRRERRAAVADSRRAVAALATALRAGRVARRRMLRNLRTTHFLDVLPLWLGTLREIDDMLPVEARSFDVLICDEASQIDQLRAATALARAARAVVVGDPRQLRHVSFVADADAAAAARAHGLDGPLARLADVRRNSLFDVAAGAGDVVQLQEHYRSIPHLIRFSDREFYGESLRLMTQHPSNEAEDAITPTRVDGRRGDDGVNAAEVEAVRAAVRGEMATGSGTIGVVTPFRAQADAVEEMLIAAFRREERRRHAVRAGTVHAFQGNERDVVVLSLALGPDDLGSALRFVEDPNLFNVMVTRARRRVVLLHSFDPADLPRGLLADYFRHADEPPLPAESPQPPRGWVAEVSGALAAFRVRQVTGYPVGGWHVDLAVGDGAAAVGVECVVHPGGVEPHMERHLALRRAGWEMTDAFQSRWLADPDRAAETIVSRVLGREGISRRR